MSDGPHKTLGMRRAWKRLCKLADNRATSAEEIRDAIAPALEQDWRVDISPGLFNRVCRVLSDPQGGLFLDQRLADLEGMRRDTAGHGFARSLLECAMQSVLEGRIGHDAVLETTRNAIIDRGARGFRQVEEHYCRESSAPRAQNVRSRLENSLGAADVDALARSFAKIGPASPARSPAQQDGLDDGVPLR